MNSYGLIDLHCDTLAEYWKYAHTGNPDTLDDPGRVLSLSNMPKDVHWAQFYAVFIPDEERGQAAIDYFEKNRANFYRQMEKFGDRVAPCRNADDMEKAWAAGKTAAFLTIENGSALAGDLSRVHTLAEQGVRAITLTWNGENELGSGHTTDHGMSEFGKSAVREMEKENILVVPPQRPRLRGSAGGRDEALRRHALQRPRAVQPQAQPDGRHDPRDGAPRLPDRSELLCEVPARRRRRKEP